MDVLRELLELKKQGKSIKDMRETNKTKSKTNYQNYPICAIVENHCYYFDNVDQAGEAFKGKDGRSVVGLILWGIKNNKNVNLEGVKIRFYKINFENSKQPTPQPKPQSNSKVETRVKDLECKVNSILKHLKLDSVFTTPDKVCTSSEDIKDM